MVLNRRNFIKYSIISSLVTHTGGSISNTYASDTNISLRSLNVGIESDILLVIDVQNDFCPGGSLGVKDGDKIIKNINTIQESFNNVALTQDWWALNTDYADAAIISMTSPIQLSMLKVNPATAYLMLKKYVKLQPGDWIIQDAANSAVGQYIIRLAKIEGIKTINIVRRKELANELKEIGADFVILDTPNMASEVKELTNDSDIKLAIDAVGGDIILRIGDCLAEEATILNYGGEKYFCIARAFQKRSGGFDSPESFYSIGLGCRLNDASKMIYGERVLLDSSENIELTNHHLLALFELIRPNIFPQLQIHLKLHYHLH